MGCTVLTDRDAGVGRADLNVEMRITDGVADLFVGSSRSKHGKGAGKRNQAGRGKACRNIHHVCFRDTAVEMAFRKSFFEHTCLRCTCQIRIQHDNIFMLCSELCQCIAVAFSGSDLFYF